MPQHQGLLGKEIYTLLLFLACFVKCDVAITNNLTEFIYSLLTESPVAATGLNVEDRPCNYFPI